MTLRLLSRDTFQATQLCVYPASSAAEVRLLGRDSRSVAELISAPTQGPHLYVYALWLRPYPFAAKYVHKYAKGGGLPFRTDLTAGLTKRRTLSPLQNQIPGMRSVALSRVDGFRRPVSAPGTRRVPEQLTRPRSTPGVPRHTFSATLCGVVPPLLVVPPATPFYLLIHKGGKATGPLRANPLFCAPSSHLEELRRNHTETYSLNRASVSCSTGEHLQMGPSQAAGH